MKTPVYTSKKLEKLIKKLIQKDSSDQCGILGKWNATVFYMDRKKCWLISNAKTQYVVVLTDIKVADFKNIEQLFKNALYGQLVYDGILTEFENVSLEIGELEFLPTDNDRKTIGFQNHHLHELEWRKHEFGSLDNMPIKDLVNRLNTSPIHIGKGRKVSDYTDAIEEMKKLLVH